MAWSIILAPGESPEQRQQAVCQCCLLGCRPSLHFISPYSPHNCYCYLSSCKYIINLALPWGGWFCARYAVLADVVSLKTGGTKSYEITPQLGSGSPGHPNFQEMLLVLGRSPQFCVIQTIFQQVTQGLTQMYVYSCSSVFLRQSDSLQQIKAAWFCICYDIM